MRHPVQAILAVAAVVAGCSSSSGSDGASPAPSSDGPASDADAGAAPPPAPPAPPPSDGGSPDADAGAKGTYRTSLGVCWTDVTCKRAMIVAHGGDWSATTVPYGSMGAVVAAFDHDVDAVKIDVRVTKDNVPVVSHSSPLQIYESLDCYNKRIEDMTAAEVTGCHFVPSTTETFQRLDAMLGYARGKMLVQLTVKEPTDFARAIAEVVALGAQDFAFFEVTTSDLQTLIPSIPGSDQVYYLVNVGTTLSEIDVVLGTIKNPRVFMVEMDPSPDLGTVITTKLHPGGVRAFTYDSAAAASVAQLTSYFTEGIDVVSTNATANNLQARVAVNTSRGVSPP
jgi:glycerophosphoryl diester phosphodiesterase